MKIIMTGWYKPQTGGGANVIWNISHRLVKRGHKVWVINMEEPGLPYRRHWRDKGIEIYQEKLLIKKYTPIQTLIQVSKRALQLKYKVKPDIIHSHSVFHSGIGLIDRRTPFVITMHGYPSLESVALGVIQQDSLQFNLIRYLEIKTIERADAVIAVDRRIYRWVIIELGADPSKVFHLPNSVDVSRFINYKLQYNRQFPLIGFIKGLSPKNGPDVLLKAMKYVIREFPTARLLIIGEGPLKNYLQDLAVKLGLQSHVTFMGRVPYDKVPFYYSLVDIVVVPSKNVSNVEEATSLSMLEGMASSKPTIVSNIGGLKQIMEKLGHLSKYLIFSEDNPKELADKIVTLLDNSTTRKKVSLRERKYVEARQNWESYVDKLEEVYNYALSLR